MKRSNYPSLYIFTFLLFSLTFLSGCSEQSLELQVRYDDISGLSENHGVYFERNRVGQVENVSYEETGDYLVTISIIPDFKNAATKDSQFYIGPDPTDDQNKAVIITQEQPGGKVLQEGSIVEGAVKERYFDEIISDLRKKAEEAQSELHSTVEELKKTFDTTSQQFNAELQETITSLLVELQKLRDDAGKLPERQEVKQLQEKFREFTYQFNQAHEEVRSFLRDTLLPKIRTELDGLRERLKKHDRDEELENIDKQLDEISVV